MKAVEQPKNRTRKHKKSSQQELIASAVLIIAGLN